ncbi:dTMP kinase [Algiphilus sp.]|uniref:dTMP kinase n=1 Tax=Algiphilus sp. TaxID=1872431 RepID=UPI003B52A5CD
MNRGRFIVLEGGEGAGKSTQVETVAEWLRSQGRDVLCTREPGGTPLAERIRGLLIDRENVEMTPECETLLVFAARSQHLQKHIAPALAAGQDVVSDRFVDASYAYQGGGRGIGMDHLDHLASWICDRIQPDLVLLLDLEPTVGRARAARRGAADRFEQEALRFAEKVREVYLERAHQHPERYAIIDAGQNQEDVRSAVQATLEARLK